MGRPTTRDLARAAGVSLATVDRVLNQRPNVSSRSTKKVLAAIEQIGFVRNIAAANLAKSTAYQFRIVLPDTGDQYVAEIIREVGATNDALRTDLVTLDVALVPVEDPHAVSNYLATLDPDTTGGVAIMTPESPQVRDAITRLGERGIQVVQFLSGAEHRDNVDFVGIDNDAAGATAARLLGRFNGDRPGTIAVIAETMRAEDSIARRIGFDRVINTSFPHLRPLPSLETHADPERASRIIGRTLDYNRDIVGLYVMSPESRVPLLAATEHTDLGKLVTIVHERTPFSISALKKGDVDAIIAQNPGHAVRSAVRLLRARTDKREPVISQEQLRIEILLEDNL